MPGSCSKSLGTNEILNQTLTLELDGLPLSSLYVGKSRFSWENCVIGPVYLGIYWGCATGSLLAVHRLFLHLVQFCHLQSERLARLGNPINISVLTF